MYRVVAAELLDGLDAGDPAARAARRDLRRIHRFMGTRRVLVGALSEVMPMQRHPLAQLLELGAGDGTLMLGVARELARHGCRARITLLDRQRCVDRQTIDAYAGIGWQAVETIASVEDWIAGDLGRTHWDVIVVSLFLHHFETPALERLLRATAVRSRSFVACEPRRAPLALAASHMVGVLGANAVTRTDAVLSVRAGFVRRELSHLWPADNGPWRLRERRAGLFSHCFQASRRIDV